MKEVEGTCRIEVFHMQIDFSGKLALITGATGDLGRVITRTLAQAGADVVIHYHANAKKADELAQEVRSMGRQALTVQADIRQQESVEAMYNTIVGWFKAPEIVIANAVSSYQWTSVLAQPAQDFVDQFATCVMQNVYLSKAFIPAMIEKEYGRYIAMNSECSILTAPESAAYASAKKGMDGLLRVLMKEVSSHQITVNQVAPGWTISDRDRANDHPTDQGYISRVPMQRRGTDQEIANVVAFLASDLASFINGAYIPVNGGTALPSI
jgi:3-oxoacyl-[acyl-carrier protein] reductase